MDELALREAVKRAMETRDRFDIARVEELLDRRARDWLAPFKKHLARLRDSGAGAMNDVEAKLIRDMRRVAASHRRDGERRTADLLERAAQKLEKLLERMPPDSAGVSSDSE